MALLFCSVAQLAFSQTSIVGHPSQIACHVEITVPSLYFKDTFTPFKKP